jgi:hypothetical protein
LEDSEIELFLTRLKEVCHQIGKLLVIKDMKGAEIPQAKVDKDTLE